VEHCPENVLGVLALVQKQVWQHAYQTVATPLEVGVDVIDLHADEFRPVPFSRFLGMRVEEEPAIFGDLPRERCGVGLIAQNDSGRDPKRHNPFLHLETGDEEFSLTETAPLQIEISASLYGMIAQANEIYSGSFKDS
jgi:hypothetical protein